MRTFAKLSLVTGALILSLSCGSTKPVQYVYVENPVYAPAPAASSNGITVDNSSMFPAKNTGSKYATSNYSSPTQSGQNYSNTAQPQRCQMLADEYVPGYYRGFGFSKKQNLNAARGVARQVALANALKQIVEIIEDTEATFIGEDNSSSKEEYWNNIVSKTKRYKITNAVTLCSSTNQNNGYYEVSMCIQTTAEDLLEFLEPELNQLAPADREAFKNTVVNYNAMR